MVDFGRKKCNTYCTLLGIVVWIIACNRPYKVVSKNSRGNVFIKEFVGDTISNNYTEKVTVYYPSGKILSKYQLINHQLEGNFTTFYESGKIDNIVNYHHGLLQGDRIDYYENGQIKNLLPYNNNKLNGSSYSYYLGNRLSDFGYFIDSSLTYSLRFDSNGNKIIDNVRPFVDFPKSINLGNIFRMKVVFPVLKGFTDLANFNLAVIPVNIFSVDSIQKYRIVSVIRNHKWKYDLINNQTKKIIKDYNGPLYQITFSPDGNGEFEFTPPAHGKYGFIGVATSFPTTFLAKDTDFVEHGIRIVFNVGK